MCFLMMYITHFVGSSCLEERAFVLQCEILLGRNRRHALQINFLSQPLVLCIGCIRFNVLRLQDPVKSTVAISLETLRSQRNQSMHRGTLHEQHDVDAVNNAFNGLITSHHELLLILGGSRDLSFHFRSVDASNPYITHPRLHQHQTCPPRTPTSTSSLLSPRSRIARPTTPTFVIAGPIRVAIIIATYGIPQPAQSLRAISGAV